MAGEIDSVGAELAAWLEVMPDGVNPKVEAVRQRVGRIGRHLDRLLSEIATDHGLTVGDWAALSAVHRLPGVDGCTPKELAEALGVTSGTMTVRIERLLRSGFIEPVAVSDQRSRPVRLTSAGLHAWELATEDRAKREADVFTSALSGRRLGQLDQLLSVLLAGLESDSEPVSRHDTPRNG